ATRHVEAEVLHHQRLLVVGRLDVGELQERLVTAGHGCVTACVATGGATCLTAAWDSNATGTRTAGSNPFCLSLVEHGSGARRRRPQPVGRRSEGHTSELQSRE